MGHGGERRRKKEETLGGLILERRGYLRRELLGKGFGFLSVCRSQ